MNEAAVDWARLKALFAQALEIPRDQRDVWLQAQCRDAPDLLEELRALLDERDARPDSLLAGDATPLVAGFRFVDNEQTSTLPSAAQIGPYRVLQPLGQGGMGSVYLVERADGQIRRRVALKLIRSELVTPELRERFLRERDILARLAHPYIAQLHDGGVDDAGVPFFTLEYIDGVPLTRWCDLQRSSIGERVALLLKVCEAVQAAHRNLVVHRDLKPSNILVNAEGEPKLLDFGIAKLLDAGDAPGLTATHSRPMTREYAAPEQVLGEPITTATDVYALGILLYELLSGRLPYARAERGETSWPKAIVEEAPEPLSRAIERPSSPGTDVRAADIAQARRIAAPLLRRSLQGDLNRIAQRALDKAPEARYASVTAFAADLRAWSQGRALPGGSRRYRLEKFIRRNKIAVAMAAAFLALVIAGLTAIALEARQAAAEAQAALRQTRTTAAVKDYLLDLFHKADPNVAKGKEITARELVDRGVERLARLPADQAELKSELQTTLGTIYFQLGLNKQAADLHEQAFEALKNGAANPVLTASAERFWATELVPLGDLEKARTLGEDALARTRAAPGASRSDLVHALYTVGWIAESQHKAAPAVALATEATELARQAPVDEALLALALNLRGSAYWAAHDNDAAAKSFAEAMDINARTLGPDDQLTLRDCNGVATAYYAGGRYVDAVTYFRKSHDGFARLYGPSDVRALHAQEGLALVEREAGLFSESRRDFEAIFAALKLNPPQNNRFELDVRGNYAMLLADFGQLTAAESAESAVLEEFVRLMGAKSASAIEAQANVGLIHGLQGKLESAEQEIRQSIEAKHDSGEADVSTELAHLSDVRRRRDDVVQALMLGEQSREIALKLYGERSRQAANAHYYLALALLAAQQRDAAIAELRAALASFKLIVPPDGLHPASAGARATLGQLLNDANGSRDESEALLREALKLRGDTLGLDHPLTIEARDALGRFAQSVHVHE